MIAYRDLYDSTPIERTGIAKSGIYCISKIEFLNQMETRAFNSGNSLAIRIPKSLDFVSAGDAVEIRRVGDTLVLRAVREQSLIDVPGLFAQFPKSFMAEGRSEQSQRPRAALTFPAKKTATKRK